MKKIGMILQLLENWSIRVLNYLFRSLIAITRDVQWRERERERERLINFFGFKNKYEMY